MPDKKLIADRNVLTEEAAGDLLKAVEDYFSEKHYVNGKHRSTIIAEQMLREGDDEGSRALAEMHRNFERAKAGNYKDGLWPLSLEDEGSIKFVLEHENRKFQPAIKGLFSEVDLNIVDIHKTIESAYDQVADGNGIDWDKSSEVLAGVKQERFPDSMTMIEKLGAWHKEHKDLNL